MKIRVLILLAIGFGASCKSTEASKTSELSSQNPGYEVQIQRTGPQRDWDGFGTSLAWWANGVGLTPWENLYADILFTQKSVAWDDQLSLPGLGLSLIRYNVGGGSADDQEGEVLPIPSNPTRKATVDYDFWKHRYKKIEGFQVFPQQGESLAQPVYDWERDKRQRSLLKLAEARGVTHIEFFSDSPMWWFKDSKSSRFGRLLTQYNKAHAEYLANVIKHAKDEWGVHVQSVEPFNEPSANFWLNSENAQEGAFINDPVQQAEIIGYLRGALDARGLFQVEVTGSDENTVAEAFQTAQNLWRIEVDRYDPQLQPTGKKVRAYDLLSKINVHGYDGIAPNRNNAGRVSLRQTLPSKTLWMSEYGDGDALGKELATTLLQDINILKANGWVYWQAIEPYSGWGLINAAYAAEAFYAANERGRPLTVNPKYYVMAQFSRYLRPGSKILGSNDINTVIAYDKEAKTLNLVTVNYGQAQNIRYALSDFGLKAAEAKGHSTQWDSGAFWQEWTVPIVNGAISFDAKANTVYSVSIPDVVMD